jgi:hypothetical protein
VRGREGEGEGVRARGEQRKGMRNTSIEWAPTHLCAKVRPAAALAVAVAVAAVAAVAATAVAVTADPAVIAAGTAVAAAAADTAAAGRMIRTSTSS